jgi:hypothetical protein
MKVKKIWDKSTSNFSVDKLLSKAAGFCCIENSDAAQRHFVFKAKATYIDQDGDEVNVTLDDELKDAFLQVLSVWPVCKTLVIEVAVTD